ncbi:MAG: M14 family zinc carboxypeptidase [Ornithinimicrobium sp.]|uniref:M14 family zinc carboxypeptidase n=1 Tax=Ornithinimicrobium sp. TaxID=1977084 RepID=UPI0026E05AFD|nr:M14 family zinc carboxypeptidase [Ornithinimicrobium sp.]MDO5740837.1 M14 family zinc carboxypeptidase [Ornithinimicrobium sp.]
MPRSTPASRTAVGALAMSMSLAMLTAPAAVSATPVVTKDAAQTQAADRGQKASETTGVQMPQSYPFQPQLKTFPYNADDKSYAANLVGYANLAPRLTALMAKSDRVSTQIVGTSTSGRDLYLVTLTAPEKKHQTKAQTRWRELIQNRPAKAAKDKRLAADYKTPIWFSANIHGNEWEGTDASLQYLEELATSKSPEVAELLQNHRLYFSLTLNPDGRVAATRATALGYDPNRDMITNTLPESRSFVQTTQALLPIYSADLHGYTGVLQVEPTGPPHGENYEYDLFIPHNYAAALHIEKDVVAADISGNPLTPAGGIKIPYRDTPSGWDDYPPIFTAQYAAFFGALTSTVELPLGRTREGVMDPKSAAINVAVAKQVLRSTVDYVSANSDEILANQIEFFRRGVAGEPKVSLTEDNIAAVTGPDQWKPLWDVADNQDAVHLPRAYVIPAGVDQRSASDANALVKQLLFHGIEVGELRAPKTVDGTTYAAGSYVIDMHQPKKGLANALLDLGTDISAKVPSMYDISAWSYSYLWGATVDKVGDISDAPIRAVRSIDAPVRQAAAPKKAQHLTFEVAGLADYRALNDLLGQDATTWLLPTGQAVIAPQDRAKAVNAAYEHDVALRPSTKAEMSAIAAGSAKELEEVTVGYVGNQEALSSLQELGFDPVKVDAAAINDSPTVLDDLDVLWVSSELSFTSEQQAGRDALKDWLADGNALVGAGSNALAAASGFGLVSAVGQAGPRRSNGIVAVDTPADSLLAPHAQDYAFVYPPLSFTELGAGTKAEQFYAEGNPLLAGHWRGDGAAAPEAAGGKASVISGQSADGGKAVVFGTSVFFRNHPKGGIGQVGQAIFWAAPDGS